MDKYKKLNKLATKSKDKTISANREKSNANLILFEKGQSGNPSGRPKLIGIAYKELLAQVNPNTGKTHAEEIAEAQAYAAKQSMMPHSVSAAKEIRQATEGGDDEGKSIHYHLNIEMARELAALAKPIEAEVIEDV